MKFNVIIASRSLRERDTIIILFTHEVYIKLLQVLDSQREYKIFLLIIIMKTMIYF